MRIIFSLGFSFVLTICFAQSLDKCGLDDEPWVSMEEARFLNVYHKERDNDFDFEGKKIIFVKGNSGHQIGTKSEYFENIKKWKELHESSIASSVIVLNEKEKNDSGGYDAIVTYWVKVLTKKRKRQIIKKIN